MKCKLCLQEKDLLKRSHIIPNFMYKELFDEKHILVKIDLSTNKDDLVQSGEYEANILCKDCDNSILGGLENYANNVLYGGNIKGISMVNEINKHNVSYTKCSGIDYKKFKLFLLSIIWRSSISSKNFYNFVDLGPYEEIIRKMIIDNDPQRQIDFPCIICSYRHNKGLPYQVVSQPRKFRNNKGKTQYSILIGGILYIFIIAQNYVDDVVKEAVINENGEIKILHIESDQAGKILSRSFGEMDKNLFDQKS